MKYRIRHIKYFSEDGRDRLPDGSHYQKGGYLHECELNAQKFRACNFQYVLKNGSVIKWSKEEHLIFMVTGAIIVFPNSFDIGEKAMFDYLKKEFEEHARFLVTVLIEFQFAFSIGNFFYGRHGAQFNGQSLCVEINGVNWKWFTSFSEIIMTNFQIKTGLVKELEREQLFLLVNE